MWSYDFVEDQTHNGRKFRMLNIIDEFSRECLAMVPLRRFRSNDVIDVLTDLFIEHGPPEHIRSDNVLGHEGKRDLVNRSLCADIERRGMHSEPDGFHRQRDRSLP